MLQSHNGWPASKDAAEIQIISVPIEGTKVKVRCAKAVAPLIANDEMAYQITPILIEGEYIQQWQIRKLSEDELNTIKP